MVSQIRKEEEAEKGTLHKDTIAKVRAEGFAVTTMYSAYRGHDIQLRLSITDLLTIK
jgi:hypothetical protein